MTARTFGPILLMALGALLLAGPLGSTTEVGTLQTTTTTCGVSPVGTVSPCSTTTQTTIDPCGPVVVGGAVEPCSTTSTVVTTTVVDTTTVESSTTLTGELPTTTPPPPGSAVDPGDQLGDGLDNGSTPPPATQPAAAPARKELARTGTSDGPTTVAGITLILLGAVLAISGRRHQLRRSA